MRRCVVCAYYAEEHIMRRCVCALLRSIRLWENTKKKRRPWCAGPKGCIFLRIFERESKSRENHCFSITCEGNFCSMTFAKCAPATRFSRTQQKISCPRAASEAIMQNAVTLVLLEHVRPCQKTIPAVRVDVRNPLKTQL